MHGSELRQARRELGWTQVKAAARLGVSQTYLSLLESGQRELTCRLQEKARKVFRLGPESLPLPGEANWQEQLSSEVFVRELAGMQYPGFAYLRTAAKWNPAEFLLRALAQRDLAARVLEALPWVMLNQSLDWEWLVPRAKSIDVQNRLGFLVSLTAKLAERHQLPVSSPLRTLEARLQVSALRQLGTLCQDGMTRAERRWLKENSTAEAAQWNLLCDLDTSHVVHF